MCRTGRKKPTPSLGIAELGDLLNERVAILKADHDRAREALGRARSGIEAKRLVSPEAAERFGALKRQRLLDGDTPARATCIGAIIDRIDVDDGIIRSTGRKDVLEQAVASGGAIPPSVRTCVLEWRTVRDKSANSYVIDIAL